MTRMNPRENMLRTVFFQRPERIPVTFAINAAYFFENDPEDVLDFKARHPFLFPGFVRPKKGEFSLDAFRETLPPFQRKSQPFADDFSCIWETAMDGLTGTVTKHPLADLSNFANYRFPDPNVCMGIGPVDWEKEKKRIADAKAQGAFTRGGLRHGHTFLQLSDICGYENLLFAMMDEQEELDALINGITDFNCAIIDRYLSMDVDMITIPEDLGMQQGPMLSPSHFRRYIKPAYQRMMDRVRKAGKIVHMHSDGDIRTLVDDIIEGGCQVINLQDLVNGIDWIADRFRGRTCVEVDIDRQLVTYGGTPKDIDDLIHEEVEKIGTPQGGLMLIYGLYPGVSIENADAVAASMEKYSLYYTE